MMIWGVASDIVRSISLKGMKSFYNYPIIPVESTTTGRIFQGLG